MNMIGGKSDNIMMDLDKLRELIRKELGFGGKMFSDGENTWLAVSAKDQREEKNIIFKN